MILRRVIAHFRKQEWTAIAIDFVIVVVGVFIGIQVSNWNASRADERRGEAYVARLIADLTSDHQKRSGLLAYYDTVNASAVRAIEMLNAPTADDRELVINAYRATELAYAPLTRATWDEIVSSGDIGLLPRAAVQEGLNVLYGVDVAEQARAEISNSRLRAHVRSLIPHRIQAAIRTGCSDVVDLDGRVLGFVEECALDASPEEIAAAAEILKADPHLLQSLTLHISAISSVRSNLRGDIYSIERSIELLKSAP